MQAGLLERIAAGDNAAARALIDRYGGLVWSLARRTCPTDAEDAVQEVFAEVWRSAARFDPKVASEATFVAMITRRRLIDRRRRAQRRPAPAPLDEAVLSPTERAPDSAQVGEEAARAAAALGGLSEDQQRCIRLAIQQGLSHEDIAQATGLPLGTVKTHIRRGLMKVREVLESSRNTARIGAAT